MTRFRSARCAGTVSTPAFWTSPPADGRTAGTAVGSSALTAAPRSSTCPKTRCVVLCVGGGAGVSCRAYWWARSVEVVSLLCSLALTCWYRRGPLTPLCAGISPAFEMLALGYLFEWVSAVWCQPTAAGFAEVWTSLLWL